jgi:hypothetical protein
MAWSGRFDVPAIETKTVPELLTMRDELQAELAAVVARLQELERLGIGLPPKGVPWSSSVQRKPVEEPEPDPEPSPNAHPEGADAA